MKDDSINRQATIDVLDVGAELLKRVLDDADIVGVERAKYEWGLNLIESYIADVKGLPSAQPERPKGEWIDLDSDTEKYDDIMCSNCKQSFTVDAYRWCDIGFTVDDLKFCPNCGADMRGREDE